MRDPRSFSADAGSEAQTGVFRIGSAELRLATRELLFDGAPVDVQPKVLDLLSHLVLHRDRVVGKDELFDCIWPSVIVSDATLSQTIKRARDIFRLHGFETDVIRTVARRGYQFQHTVDAVDAATVGASVAPAPLADAVDVEEAIRRAASEVDDNSLAGAERAEGQFRAVLAAAPDHIAALLGLSDVLRRLGATGERPREDAFHEALTLVERAVRADPDNGLAHLQRAEIQHRHFWDFDGARASFERALALLPDSGDVQAAFSRFLAKVGDHGGAVAAARAAAASHPDVPRAYANLALRLIKVGELDAATAALEALRDLDDDFGDIPWLEANILLRAGDYRGVLRVIALEELDHLRLSLSAIAYHHLARTAQARRTLDTLIAADADGAAFQIAEVYAEWDASDEAIAWLERALSGGDPGMAELYSSLHFESLMADPRIPPIAAQVGLPPLP